MRPRIGVPMNVPGVKVRGVNHFTECLVAMFPKDYPDEACTCMDWSPT